MVKSESGRDVESEQWRGVELITQRCISRRRVVCEGQSSAVITVY